MFARIFCLLLSALPLVAADFVISPFGVISSNFSLTFPTSTGQVYGVERASALDQSWTVLTTFCGTGSSVTFTEALRPGTSFYRVSATPSPPLQLTPHAPTLAGGAVSLPDAVISQPYAIDISACPSGTAPFSFQVTGSPPAGLTLNITADSVRVRGVATNSGRAQFEVRVADAASATVTRTFDVRAIAPAPLIAEQSVPLQAGAPANWALQASGGTGGVSWSIASGNLPEGITLSPQGVLTGTPTASAAEAGETGEHTAELRVTDTHTDRLTGAPAPRSATRAITHRVRLSYNLNIYAPRANGPSFSARCFACHGPGFPPNVTSGNALDIIGVASNPAFFCPDRVYITPGDSELSLIYKKLTAPPCGERMPQGGPYLNTTESNRLLRWILQLQPGDED